MQEDIFHEVADEFINLANELSDDWAVPLLADSMVISKRVVTTAHIRSETIKGASN